MMMRVLCAELLSGTLQGTHDPCFCLRRNGGETPHARQLIQTPHAQLKLGAPRRFNPLCPTFVDRPTLVGHASFLSANERGKKPSCPTVYTKNHAQLKLGAPNIGAPNKTPCATFVDRSTLVEHASFLSVNERGKKPSCPTGYKKNPCPTKVGCSKHWRSKALQT